LSPLAEFRKIEHHISIKFNAGNPMLDVSRDINSLSNFKRNTSDFMQRLKSTKAPLVLTINGVSELVVQSAEGYQRLLDRLEYLETVAGIQRGLEELADGKAVPAITALEELREKLKQPPSA
jgi:PHD/YefM family antitoxin component YafN of YafNO toxin-antitoxin module